MTKPHPIVQEGVGIAVAGLSDGKMMGLEGGLIYSKAMGKQWAIHTGLSYIWSHSDQFSPPVVEQVTAYSFGSRAVDIQMKPTSLHYLSMPLHLSYQRSSFGYFGGINADYLLAMYGNIEVVDEENGTTQEPATFLNTRGLHSLTFRPEVGFLYNISTRNRLQLSTSYRLPEITKSSDVLPLSERYSFHLKFVHYVF